MLECPRCHGTHLTRLGKSKTGLPILRCVSCDKRFTVIKKACPKKEYCKDYIKGNFCCDECPQFCQKSGL
jgi:transposase-like protein